MVITVVEAHVAPEKGATLEQSYRAMTKPPVPSQIIQTFLWRDVTDPTRWRIVTHWRSREALQNYHQLDDVPSARRLFLDVGAEPSHSVFDVVVHVSP